MIIDVKGHRLEQKPDAIWPDAWRCIRCGIWKYPIMTPKDDADASRLAEFIAPDFQPCEGGGA